MDRRRILPLFVVGAAILVVFLGLNSMVDFVTDDFGLVGRIASFGEIPSLVWQTYNEWDGRLSAFLINHALLFLPKAVTVCALALTVTSLILLVCMHALGSGWKARLSWKHLLCAFCLIWLSVPSFGQVFFWRTGSNYGVLCVLCLLFLLPYRGLVEKRTAPSWPLALCVPLAACIGLGDYNTTIVLAMLAAGAGLFACVRDRRVRVLPFLPPAALLAGFYVAFTAPGNARRVTAEGVTDIGRWEGIVEHFRNQPDVQMFYAWPYLLLAVSLLALWGLARSRRKDADCAQSGGPLRRPSFGARVAGRLLEERPLLYALAFFLAAQAAQAAFAFAPFASKRAYTSSVLFMILAALTLFFHVWPQCRGAGWGRWAKLYWASAFTVFLVTLGSAFIMFHATKRYSDACAAAAIAAAPGEVCFPPVPYRSDAYLFHGRTNQLEDNRGHWKNQGYARYYGLSSVGLCTQRFDLVPEDGGGTRFRGEVRDSVLHFTYGPAEADRNKPFVFAFIQVPRNPLRHALERALQEHLEDSWLFRKSVANRYDKVTPEMASSQGGTLAGSAAMPHVEHTDRGYIVHYDEGGGIANLIPLEIVRRE